ncbi:MAG: hypothetical protein JOZ31_14185 [Verrucomicrobia bacterium]|nr:hypothetical protein [Verrucomicrobiota bacterium]
MPTPSVVGSSLCLQIEVNEVPHRKFEEFKEVRSSGVQEVRRSGVQEFRSSGVQEVRRSGISASAGRDALPRVRRGTARRMELKNSRTQEVRSQEFRKEE